MCCSFDSEDVPAMCRKNAAAASAVGRKDLVQVRQHLLVELWESGKISLPV